MTSALQALGQKRLLEAWEQLLEEQRKRIERQIRDLDPEFLAPPHVTARDYHPFSDVVEEVADDLVSLGRQAVAQGRVGCLVVAGGDGSRLGFSGPKGALGLSVVHGKSLFQMLSEKVQAASHLAGCPLPLAIMTSPRNHAATERFFQENDYFGLDITRVRFFCQRDLPLVGEDGQFVMESEGLASGPGGNGVALADFYLSGVWHEWQSFGVEHIHFLQVDNALAIPFDEQLVGLHLGNHNDVTLVTTRKERPEEKVGVLVQTEAGPHVVEYNELDADRRQEREQDGQLRYGYANLSQFAFSLDFVRQAASRFKEMPWHIAKKEAQLESGPRQVQKLEKFIFDVLPFASKVQALLRARADCFAPLKNWEGSDSIETVREALLQRDRKIFRDIFQEEPPATIIELAADFLYPTRDLVEHWRSREVPRETYVEG